MNLTLTRFLAWRYLRGKRSANAVPILSRISMIAIAVSSCAMVILFSVLNGFEFLVKDLYKAFYPEIKITAARGKFFSISETQFKDIKNIQGIQAVTPVLEDNVLLNSDHEQKVATIKGIENSYSQVNNIKPYIEAGADSITATPEATAIVGSQLMNQLGIELNNAFSTIVVYYPNPGGNSLDPESAFQSLRIKPAGTFKVQDEFDSKYILASLPLVQELLKAQRQYSSVEIKLAAGADEDEVKAQLIRITGQDFTVASRFEQNRTMYMVMRTEKWAVFAILLLVLLIASFNMIGALSLLVLEKQKDMAILKTMGAQPSSIRSIFISEGVLWSLTGGVTGIVAGIIICLGQQQFHWVKMNGTFIIDSYPVKLAGSDLALILCTIIVVGILAAWYPAMKATRTEAVSLRSN